MENAQKYKKIPVEVSIHLRYLHQDLKLPLKELQKRYPQYPITTLHNHCKKAIGASIVDKRCSNKGRPKVLSERDDRKLEASLIKLREDVGDLFSTDIERDCKGVTASNRTIRRSLNAKGYKFSQCRKKGQLSREDCKKRVAFAKKCKKFPERMWTEGISFYLDGTGWVHKNNPSRNARTMRTRTWKRPGESLARTCTAKGKKEGVGGKMAKFMVAIAHGKGVIGCVQYSGSIDGEKFAQMIEDNFDDLFARSANPNRKLFLQDGDPSQNSARARKTWEGMGFSMFPIPARSPDLNPIENTFHLIGKKLRKDAIEMNLEKETYEQFCHRAKQTVLGFDAGIIDKTIESMPKRIQAVIDSKGHRTKY